MFENAGGGDRVSRRKEKRKNILNAEKQPISVLLSAIRIEKPIFFDF